MQPGNPPDAPQLAPAIERVIRRTGRRPRTVTANRGYGEQRVDDALHNLGVRTVVIPRKGKPSKAGQTTEHRRALRRTVQWRTGREGRISCLKRQYAGTAPASRAPPGAGSGPDTASWPTTWSIAAWPANPANNQDQENKMPPALGPLPPKLKFFSTSESILDRPQLVLATPPPTKINPDASHANCARAAKSQQPIDVGGCYQST